MRLQQGHRGQKGTRIRLQQGHRGQKSTRIRLQQGLRGQKSTRIRESQPRGAASLGPGSTIRSLSTGHGVGGW
eukprot:3939117-Rhodomonas_salina.2